MSGGLCCPPPLLPDVTTAHIIDMYIYLYTEKKNTYLLDSLDINVHSKNPTDILVQHVYSGAPINTFPTPEKVVFLFFF